MTETPGLLAGVAALLAALAAVVAFVRFAPVPQRDESPAGPPAVQQPAHRDAGGLRPR